MDNKLREILSEGDTVKKGSSEHADGAEHAHRDAFGEIGIAPLSWQELERLEQLLPRYTTAEPTTRQTALLIDKLMPLLDADQAELPRTADRPRFADQLHHDRDALSQSLSARFLRSVMPQIVLLSVWFWAGSLLAVIISVLFMRIFAQAELMTATNPIVLMAPLLSLVAMVYACRSYGTPMFELERSFPLTPAKWITGKITVVLCYYIALFMFASFIFTWHNGTEIVPFTISWLVPLCLYSAITLACMLRLGSITTAFTMTGLWLAQIIGGERLGPLFVLGDSGYKYWAFSKTAGALVTLMAIAYIIFQLHQDTLSVRKRQHTSMRSAGWKS